MKIEFLDNYKQNEYDFLDRLYKNLRDYNDIKEGYLICSKFNKLLDPIVFPDPLVYIQHKEPIWSQIPFAGTTIIPLNPCSKENFFNEHGFEIKDISSLIGFVKEFGKVQFVLSKEATLYADMDYLEPIFNELKPTILLIPWQFVGSNELFDQWKNEFNDLVVPHLQTNIQHELEGIRENHAYYRNVMEGYRSTYFQLKLLNLEDALDEIHDYIYHDPNRIRYCLDKYNFIIAPFFYPFDANQNFTFDTLKLFNIKQKESDSTITYPIDLGKFLMKKLVAHPDSFYGCIDAIERYKSNDLYSVLESLNKKVKQGNTENLIETRDDLERILDNTWKDADKYDNYKKFISIGIDFTIGIGGAIATGSLSSLENLLVGLEITASSRLLKSELSITDKILSRFVNKNYLYCIYDFKQRHKDKLQG